MDNLHINPCLYEGAEQMSQLPLELHESHFPGHGSKVFSILFVAVFGGQMGVHCWPFSTFRATNAFRSSI